MKKKSSLLVILLISMMGIFSAQSVGQTEGSFSVSLSGGSSYSIPISTPPGLKEMTPKVSIGYSNQAGNGPLGWGWNINGVSSITRVASTKFHDGNIDGIDYSGNDRFALDGQRLILKSGTYGANDAEYQLENYSNVKVISKTNQGTEPDYFIVYYPNGNVAVYGNDATSKNTVEWKISHIDDVKYNRIQYSYIKENNSLYLSTIKYGGNPSVGSYNPVNTINFYYKSAARGDQFYVYGTSQIYSNKKLDRIEILGNNQLYRKYQLTYNTTSLNYERLVQVQESNANNETIKPVLFEYDTTDNGAVNNPNAVITNVSPGYDSGSWSYVSGYFDKDGAIDFMSYPNSKDKLYRFNSQQLMASSSNVSGALVNVEKFSEVFSTKIKLPNNKYYNLDAISTVVPTASGLNSDTEVVKINNYVSNSTYSSLDLSFTNSYTFPTIQNQRCFAIGGNDIYYSKINKKYFTGDFDGDGLSDILAIGMPYFTNYPTTCNNGPGGPLDPSLDPGENPGIGIPTGCCEESYYTDYAQVYLLKLDPANSAVQTPQELGWNNVVKSSSKIYVADFDGDGVSDIYVMNPGQIVVFGFKNGVFIQKTSLSNNTINADFPYNFTDINGDGKTDVIIPTADGSSDWLHLISNAQSFNAVVKNIGMVYRKPSVNNTCYTAPNGKLDCGFIQQVTYYNFSDINGDGKADVFWHSIVAPFNNPNAGQWNYPYNTYGPNFTITEFGSVAYNLGNNVDGTANFGQAVQMWHNYYTHGGSTVTGTPIFLSNRNSANQNLDYAFFGGDKIKYISFKKDNRTDVTLKRIRENEILTTIDYTPLLAGGNGVYTDDNEEVFPYANVNIAPSVQLVSKVTKTFNGESKIQDYKYKGAVTNLEGIGFLGFKGTAVSTIYGGNLNAPLQWTVSKQDMQKRGATFEDYLLDTSVNFNSPSNFLTKTVKTFNTFYLPNKVFVNLPVQTQQIDNLTGVNMTTSYEEYDSFYNLKKSVETAAGGQKITLFDFENNPSGISNQYYIGRSVKKTESQTFGSETFSTEQMFQYTNNLLTQFKKKSNSSDYITEDYENDAYGNVIKKTVSAPGVPSRIESSQYDTTGRFVIKSTNILGFEQTYSYDNFGLLLSKTNHLNQTISYVYDGWQKKTKEIDFYNNEKNFTYDWITSGDFVNGIKLKETDPSGATTEIYTDNWGRKRLERTLSINNKWIDKRTDYDVQDRPYRVSDPYFSTNSPTRWTVTEFDQYNRIKKISLPTGKIITSSYSGLTSTVTDGQKMQAVTRDAWGNKTKVIDNGGEINYTYYGNGGLKTSNYQGHIITMEQDQWGRKAKLTDPSVGGDYTYLYDNFGQILQEENPKGKTTYTYDAFGRVNTKKILGDYTDINVTYVYKPNGLLESESGTTEGILNSYTYEYDSHYRLKKKTENIGAIISKSYTYDAFGRVNTELSETTYGSNTSSFEIQNIYSVSGVLEQIIDTSTGNLIWKLNNINEKGKILNSQLGNGIVIDNAYDSNYYLSAISHVNSSGVAVMDNTYNFNPVLGTLNSRTNGAIQTGGYNESFGYDSLQRLTSWTDPSGTQTQTYDNFGRIDNNSLVGDYKYASGNRYRKKGINLNPNGVADYSVQYLQQIEYNSNRLPVSVNLNGVSQIKFGYNIHQARSSSMYNYEPGFLIYRTIKHYSEDKTVEIYNFSQTGRPSSTFTNNRIITYIGGDAYTAPAAYIQDFTVGGFTKQGLHYLHRDYQGSILAITDGLGNVEEKRHFDAWGNLVKFVNGTGQSLRNNNMMIERGYTGHEHFLSAGLIHMNGRMYDPNLHTFLSVDSNIQDPFNTQSYNRFGYVINNPLMYTDYSGEIFGIDDVLVAVIIGAIIGGYTGYKIAKAQGVSGWGMVGCIIGGAVIGGLSGGAGATISAAGGLMAVTSSMIVSSFGSSMLFSMLSGGHTPVSIFFGFGSVNLQTGDVGYLGEKGNSFLTNLGYFYGAFANVSDVISLFGGGTNVEVATQVEQGGEFDAVSHSTIVNDGGTGSINISVGPDMPVDELYFNKGGNPLKKIGSLFKKVPGQEWNNHYAESIKININNVNSKILESFTGRISSGQNLFGNTLNYSGIGMSCVSYVSRALWFVGVPNIGLHPFLNAMSLTARQVSLMTAPIAVPLKDYNGY